MVQEVQQQWNWYQTPDRIIGVWISERKMSDYTQIRNKKSNMVEFVSDSISFNDSTWETFATSWTYTADNGIVYKIDWWDVYMPLAWAYWVKYIPATNYNQKNYKDTLRIYLDDKVVYENEQYVGDHIQWEFPLNVGRKNKLRASFQSEESYFKSLPITLRFIKL